MQILRPGHTNLLMSYHFAIHYYYLRCRNDTLVHSWPYQNIQSGSFICDVDLKLDEWTPMDDELQVRAKSVSYHARFIVFKHFLPFHLGNVTHH